MSRRRPPLELLPLLAEAFPQTFFTDPKSVQPLKIDIHQDLLASLPTGITTHEAKNFFYWYPGRPGYKRALLHGRGRVDLTGAVVESEIPEPTQRPSLASLVLPHRLPRSIRRSFTPWPSMPSSKSP